MAITISSSGRKWILFKYMLVCISYTAYVVLRRLPMATIEQIQTEIHIDKEDIGFLVSCQAACFTLSKLICGISADRSSVVRLLIGGLTISSTAALCLAFSSSFNDIMICVLLTSFIQGCGWVPATKLISKWYSGGSYAMMFSLLGCCSTVAGLILCLIRQLYWRTSSSFLGIWLLVFVCFAYFIFRHDDISPRVDKPSQNASSSIRLSSLIYSKVIWNIAALYMFSMELRTICESWIPVYLRENNSDPSIYLFMNEVGGLLGALSSGFVLDHMSNRMDENIARKRLGMICSASMLILISMITVAPIKIVPLLGFLIGMLVNSSINVWCMVSSQSGPNHLSGACSALISFIANFGSVFAGSPIAWIISSYGFSSFLPLFFIQLVILLSISFFNINLKIISEPKKID